MKLYDVGWYKYNAFQEYKVELDWFDHIYFWSSSGSSTFIVNIKDRLFGEPIRLALQ